ncbi:hypothetical protein [Flavobacterium sp. AJR]|jgi:hypothetical protein|uniref:hypothetical protein n=1 Tax=Flavobacterium sp. AJR TaxID=1979369 RepID=UPI000A3D72A2|nr:hypothetical protein [Flavobacterium sp. AJR]OUL61113.1 hypothetical protein B8T70_16890 [Flavobacterium sp. AJR]
MKVITLILFITLTSFSLVQTSVYVCGASGAKKYHYKESCRGLSSCKQEITKLTLKQAQGYGLTLCGWED